ncbi:hypothetical protein [Actinomadura kijaniata]|uniref:hypothetical protein n=1 Tax=Actinomadura kijaniata TaxID=46161 RepID=UPI0008353928|nr:hypothetical protein [Actinomadura kijaniata]
MRDDGSLDPLRDRLRAAADEHVPDRERIRARMERAIAAQAGTAPAESPRAGRRRWAPRVTAAALATLAVTGVVTGVVWRVSEDGDGAARPMARRSADVSTRPGPVPGSLTPAPSGGATARPSRSATASRSPSAPPSAPAGRVVAAEGAVDPHSIEHWAQNNLTLRVERPLRTLTVTIRVRRTERVAATGAWQTLPGADFETTTRTAGDAVVYTWRLRPGRTVPPGRHVLAAQYDRAKDHDPRRDTFTVSAGADGGGPATVRGHF